MAEAEKRIREIKRLKRENESESTMGRILIVSKKWLKLGLFEKSKRKKLFEKRKTLFEVRGWKLAVGRLQKNRTRNIGPRTSKES